MTSKKGMSRSRKPRSKQQLSRQIRKEVLKLAEPKYVQTNLASSISNSGVILPLASIVQGDYSTDRAGNKVLPTSWSIRGNVTGSDNFNYVRLVVFQWNDDNLVTTPQITELFENTSGTGSLYSTFNRQNLGVQYRVLADKLLRVSHNNMNPDINKSRIIKLKGYKYLKEMTFQGAAVTGFGQIYICMISDSSVLTHPSFEGFSVVNFRDL